MKIKITIRNQLNSKGEHPIILRITHKNKSKIITLGLNVSPVNWDKQKNKYVSKFKNENLILDQLSSKANGIILKSKVEGSNLSLGDFEKQFKGLHKNNGFNAITFFKELVDEQLKSNKLGNAKAYNDTINALIRFKGSSIPFKHITAEFLNKWEVFLRSNNNKNGGIAFKMRELMAMLNKAINRGYLDLRDYPFNGYKISKLKLNPEKTALSIKEWKRFENADLNMHRDLLEAHQYFIFSVYTRGMNFKDMMLLKWSNVKNGRIEYIRSKTGKRLSIKILPVVKMILERYKNQERETEYIFPILLNNKMTPRQIQNRQHKVLGRYNRKLKLIATIAKVNSSLTSNVARHTFATTLKRSGISIEKISELMGHGDIHITGVYLKDLDPEELDEAADVLTRL
jgi:integrase/recombinase XerD